ncbi:hypothetical protein E2C01_003954 [Portunus trituberculatus]|uniref:Uncharacterized protein n=1 Tax=Portunus trituberculatus TaxID=210409 RepID=A0A5B7CNL7_PORTR|nr:hypothetical protein [Portunus trituberculatus]
MRHTTRIKMSNTAPTDRPMISCLDSVPTLVRHLVHEDTLTTTWGKSSPSSGSGCSLGGRHVSCDLEREVTLQDSAPINTSTSISCEARSKFIPLMSLMIIQYKEQTGDLVLHKNSFPLYTTYIFGSLITLKLVPSTVMTMPPDGMPRGPLR